MNVWFLLALGPVVSGLTMSVAIYRCAHGDLFGFLGFRNAYVVLGREQWAAGHRAALPIVLGGTVVAVASVTTGWLTVGFTPLIGVWALAGFFAIGLALIIGGRRSNLTGSRLQTDY